MNDMPTIQFVWYKYNLYNLGDFGVSYKIENLWQIVQT